MSNQNTIAVEVTYNYSSTQEQVYQAWLSEGLARQWFAPGLGETEPVTIDARVGGNFRMVQTRKGEPVGHHGEYLALENPNFLSFTWAMDDMEDVDTVNVYIQPTPGGSSVRLVHKMDAAWQDYADRTKNAWLTMMQKMNELISERTLDTFQTFETERLLLRPTSYEDAPFVLGLLNTPEWIQFIGDRNVKSLKAAEEYISTRMMPQLQRLGYGNYTVIRKSDGAKIGSCGLYDREGLEGIDIGFAFLKEYGGKGYALEAASKVKEVAFSVFGIKQINAITTKDNLASQKLLEKLGLKYSRLVKLPNDVEELMLYQLSL